jgi:hypothetical protein
MQYVIFWLMPLASRLWILLVFIGVAKRLALLKLPPTLSVTRPGVGFNDHERDYYSFRN